MMKKGVLLLEAGQWWGWLEMPARHPGWGASPIFVTEVKPLKTGKGILRLGFVHVMRPKQASRRTADLTIIQACASHLVGTFEDDDGTRRTAVVSAADFDWLRSWSPLLWQRRPCYQPTLMIDGVPIPGPSAQGYLDGELGPGEEATLAGATARSFGQDHPPMPDRHALLSIGRGYGAFDSWLIARGRIPKEMEEKWFVYLEQGRLLFRRSWTGFLIYDVEAQWRDDTLYLGQVTVNRDVRQYTVTDDAYDRALLLYLIDVILLGVPGTFPTLGEQSKDAADLTAWAIAGNASLS